MRKWAPAAVIAAMWLFSLAVWRRLPDRVPMHWNASGAIDRYGGRLEGALFAPLLATAIWLVMRVLPRIDPRRENYARFAGSYDLVVLAVVALLAAVHVVVLGAAMGWAVPVVRVMPVLVGALFVVIGNVLPRARPNWWFGIRTPWTLSNDRVWARTQRVGGFALVASGVVAMASALLPQRLAVPVLVAAALAAAVFSVGYSYFAWRQESSR